MARYIKEYAVPIGRGERQVLLDEGAEILGVSGGFSREWLQDVVTFYAYCTDGVRPGKPRTFQAVATDQEVPDGAIHRGTVKVGAPAYVPQVFHLVELDVAKPLIVQSERVA